MQINNNILRRISQYTCPVHGDDTYFKIGIIEDGISAYCCDLCKTQIASIIADEHQKEIRKKSTKAALRNIDKILASLNVMADMADRITSTRELVRNTGKKSDKTCPLN